MASVWVVHYLDRWEHFVIVDSVWTTPEAAALAVESKAGVDIAGRRLPPSGYEVTEVMVDLADGAMAAEDARLVP